MRHPRLLAVCVLAIGVLLTPTEQTSAETITVSPNGSDDTLAIQAALDACVDLGPGCVVQLTAGLFHTSVIEAENFKGVLQGAGKDVTTITSLPNLPCADQILDGLFPRLFTFREGDIVVTDLSFDITDPRPCDEWTFPGQGVARHDLAAIVFVTGKPTDGAFVDCVGSNPPLEFANSSFHNVSFRGTVGFPFDFNTFGVDNGLLISGELELGACALRFKSLSGQHTISNSTFESMVNGVVTQVVDSDVVIGGKANKTNSFDNIFRGYAALDNKNSSINFSHNQVSNVHFFGVTIFQGREHLATGHALPAESQFLVSHNTIHAVDLADGIAIQDRGPASGGIRTAEALVVNNTIVLDNTAFGGIVGLGSQDVLVLNNQISGSGFAGIYSAGNPCTGWTVKGNNVENVSALVAPIWLGTRTSDFLVVGGNNQANVLDFGTDNILVGVNNSQGSAPGPEMQEAMEQKLAILESF